MSNSIYLVFSNTSTYVAKMIRILSRKSFSHVSIASSLDLEEMYSFCRNYRRTPLPATFNKEHITNGSFGKYIPCEIYRIDLSEKQREEYEKIIDYFSEHRCEYGYNVLGLCTIPLQKNIRRKKKYVCSQFVAHVLDSLDIELEKDVFLNAPEDLRHLPCADLIYRGELHEFVENNSKQLRWDSITA